MIHVILWLLQIFPLIYSQSCPSGWLHDGTSCYLFVHHPESWPSAMQYCRDLHKATLVSIETAEENTFLRNHMMQLRSGGVSDGGRGYWTAGNDIELESQWVWAPDSTPVSFKDFWPGEPNGMIREGCINVWHGNPGLPGQNVDTYHWNDESCDNPASFVCELGMEESLQILG